MQVDCLDDKQIEMIRFVNITNKTRRSPSFSIAQQNGFFMMMKDINRGSGCITDVCDVVVVLRLPYDVVLMMNGLLF